MQWSATNAQFHHGIGGGTRRKLDHIDIRRGPRQSVQKRDDETANAVEAHGCIYGLINSLKKESHGSGGRLEDDMIELLHGKVCQQVPVFCRFWSMLAQPSTLGACH